MGTSPTQLSSPGGSGKNKIFRPDDHPDCTNIWRMLKRKHFPRFSIRAMLAVIALLACGANWWNFMPWRTAAKLADAISNRDSERISALHCNESILADTWRLNGVLVTGTDIQRLSRSFSDFVMGRQLVEIRFMDEDGRILDTVRANVTRFHVSKAWGATWIYAEPLIASVCQPIRQAGGQSLRTDRAGG